MATKKKMLQAAAGNAAASSGGGAGGLNVEDVFSTYLYEGNGSTQVIENGINLGQSYGSGSVKLTRIQDNGVRTGTHNDFAYGTGDFTVEAWIMPRNDDATLTANTGYYFFDHGAGNTMALLLYGGNLRYYDGTVGVQQSTQALNNYEWAHVALTRSSGTIRVFYNGTAVITVNSSHSTSETNFIVGDYGGSSGNYSFDGVMADIRVSNIARYTSNFTAPTSSFTSDSNTIVLFGQGNTLVDNGPNSLTLTANNGAEATSFGPFDAADAGEGGLVWAKQRTGTSSQHALFDTENGTLKALASSSTSALATEASVTSFNSNGFSLGNFNNTSGEDYASWTFRKAPKFFDVVTYTGNGTAGRTVSHNLGTTVGCIIVKRTSSAQNWAVYHRGNTAAPETDVLYLNLTDATTDLGSVWYDTAPTSTEFTLGDQIGVNANGETYVAYLFAHNNGDGDFGPTGDQDVIRCGSYTGTGSEMFIDLGFEPQWILTRRTDTTDNWFMVDTMRGIVSGGGEDYLWADTSNAEQATTAGWAVNPTGFTVESASRYASGGTYIYIAIRRGPMAVPTAGTDVFAVVDNDNGNQTQPLFRTGFVTDMTIEKQTSGGSGYIFSRLTGQAYMNPDATSAEGTGSAISWDYMDGMGESASGNWYAWNWQRRPNFFDVVAYTGNSTAGRTVSHNLGVAPEMMWVKGRDVVDGWHVYHSAITANNYLLLNANNSSTGSATVWNNTAPTDSVFTLGNNGGVNGSGSNYIAYLFASLDGVSKVGSFTGNGSTLNVDCGFSSGARFVIIKRDSGPWRVFDTARGIVAGNDPMLMLNLTDAEVTNVDFVDPYSSGFTVNYNGDYGFNTNGDTFYFYAIA